MDEHIPHKDTEHAINTQEMLRATLESEDWRTLTPNLPSPGHDLLPQELSQAQLSRIIDAVKDLSLPPDPEFKAATEPVVFDFGEAGTLTLVNHGESKLCFQLERDGRKMAIITQGYQSKLGMQIPNDPYLTKIATTPTETLWEYSSLRTYAVLPLPDNKALRLQEFGEPTGTLLRSVASSLRGALSRRAVVNYIAEHIPGAQLGPGTKTANEVQQPRHLLVKPGRSTPAFIDIPVVQRTTL